MIFDTAGAYPHRILPEMTRGELSGLWTITPESARALMESDCVFAPWTFWNRGVLAEKLDGPSTSDLVRPQTVYAPVRTAMYPRVQRAEPGTVHHCLSDDPRYWLVRFGPNTIGLFVGRTMTPRAPGNF